MTLLKQVLLVVSLFVVMGAKADVDSTMPPDHGGHHGDHGHHHGISLQYLGFWYTGPNCFIASAPAYVPSHVLEMVRQGAVMVETTAGYRLMVDYDPITLTRFQCRNRIDDMITSTPQGVGMFPRYQSLPYGYVEVFQRPPEAGICNYGW